jgi:hypothetical protein
LSIHVSDVLDNYWGYWTGALRTNTTHFHWPDRSSVNVNQFFMPGQPDNLNGNEYCVEVLFKYGFLFNDIPCDDHYLPFICERPLSFSD